MWCEKALRVGRRRATGGVNLRVTTAPVQPLKEDAMEVSVFRIDHLLFEGSELGLQRQLEDYPGIESVSVDTGSGIVTVRHDPTILSRRAVRRAIADCGYWSPGCEKTQPGRNAHGPSAGAIAALVLSLSALPLGPAVSYAQSEHTGRAAMHVLLGGFVPTGASRSTVSNGYAIGAQIGIALTPRIATVATAFVTQTKFREIDVVEVTLVQYDVGLEFAPGAPHESTHRVIPFVGLGAGGRTYDVREAGTATRTYPAGYVGAGSEIRLQWIALRMEARGYASRQEREAGAAVTSTDVVGLAGLAVHFR